MNKLDLSETIYYGEVKKTPTKTPSSHSNALIPSKGQTEGQEVLHSVQQLNEASVVENHEQVSQSQSSMQTSGGFNVGVLVLPALALFTLIFGYPNSINIAERNFNEAQLFWDNIFHDID